jgi:ABC-type branched-subunit amino acid transport system ATPase component
MSLLEVRHINSGYGKKQVLFDASFEVEKGHIALLIGSNGSGKSTVLKTIYGLLHPYSPTFESDGRETIGQIIFDGKDVTNHAPSRLLQLGLMYIPQKDYCFDNLTVKENMEVSGITLKTNQLFKERYDQVMGLFPALKLMSGRSPMKMSGGERQMLALAMALMHQPKLLMLDEPLAGLAPKSIGQVTDILKLLNQKHGITLLIVEQNIKEGLSLATKLIGLKLGKVIDLYEPDNTLKYCMLDEIFL